MENISFFAAFSAGLLSFLSPCILPLIPAYLSFISGVSVAEMRQEGPSEASATGQVFFNALAFVLGFSIVFILLGASATLVGNFLLARLVVLKKLGGGLVILFGLHTLGLFRIGFLDYEKRYHQQRKRFGLFGSLLVGIAFALGWTPCIGPILAAILFLAGTKETVGEGIGLLSVYSAGVGIPFLLAALGVERFFRVSSAFKGRFRTIEIVSGSLLIVVGILILTNDLDRITRLGLGMIGGLHQ